MQNIKARIVGYTTSDIDRYNHVSIARSLEKRGITSEFLALNDEAVISQLFPAGSEVKDEDLIFKFVKNIEKVDLTIFSDPFFYSNTNIVNTQKIELLKSTSTVFVNEVDNHRDISNKILMYDRLKANNVSFPKTVYLTCDIDDISLDHKVDSVGGYPVVIKNPVGSMGRGVYKCNDKEETRNILNILSTMAYINFKNNIIMQEYIDTNGIFICTRVVEDKILPRFSLGSPYADDSFKSNINGGRTCVACKVTDELRSICMAAMQATGLDTARLDIFIKSDGSLSICEVNSIGSIVINELAWNEDIGDLIVQVALKKLDSING